MGFCFYKHQHICSFKSAIASSKLKQISCNYHGNSNVQHLPKPSVSEVSPCVGIHEICNWSWWTLLEHHKHRHAGRRPVQRDLPWLAMLWMMSFLLILLLHAFLPEWCGASYILHLLSGTVKKYCWSILPSKLYSDCTHATLNAWRLKNIKRRPCLNLEIKINIKHHT